MHFVDQANKLRTGIIDQAKKAPATEAVEKSEAKKKTKTTKATKA